MKIFKINRLFSQNAIASSMYAFANVMSKGIVFLTVPIFTRMLTTSEMGATTIFNSFCSLMYPVMTLSVTAGTMQIGMSEYKDRRDGYCSETLFISTMTTLLFGTVFIAFWRSICAFSHLNFEMLLMIVLYCLFYAALDIWYTRARYEHRYVAYTVVSVSIALISTFASVICVAYYSGIGSYNLGIVKVISQNVVIITAAFFVYFLILFKGRFFFEWGLCKKIIAISWPLVFHSLSKNILDISDRLMVAYFCGDSDAGIYGTLAGFSIIIVILWNSIDVAIVPSIFSTLEKNDFNGTKKTGENALFIFLFITSISVVVMPIIAKIMTVEAYYDGLRLIPILLLSNFFLAIYHVFGTLLLYSKKTVLIMYGTIISAASNIFLNMLMLSTFGYFAAALTTVVAFALQAMLQGIMCLKEYGQAIMSIKNIVLMALICVAVCLAGAYLKYDDPMRCILLIVPAIMLFKVKKILMNQ